MIGVALIGCGRAGLIHARNLKNRIPGVALNALADPVPEALAAAKEESAEMLRTATKKAQKRSDEIVAAAKEEASGILARNAEELEREKRRAENELRGTVSELAVMMAEKVVAREVKPEDHMRLIDEFIDAVGDAK